MPDEPYIKIDEFLGDAIKFMVTNVGAQRVADTAGVNRSRVYPWTHGNCGIGVTPLLKLFPWLYLRDSRAKYASELLRAYLRNNDLPDQEHLLDLTDALILRLAEHTIDKENLIQKTKRKLDIEEKERKLDIEG